MRFSLVPLLVVVAALLPACRDARIASYRVPKEQPEPLPPILTGEMPAAPSGTGGGGAMANTAVPTAAGEGLTWTAPAHWKTKPASAMRKGSYAVVGENGAEADLSITAFPGDVGGELANLNRWRGQLSLPPIAESDLASATQHLHANGLHVTVVDFANTDSDKPQRILGALVPFEDATWFFKLMGPDKLVAAEKPAFLAFLQTVKPAAR
jgi:hypothetical protein